MIQQQVYDVMHAYIPVCNTKKFVQIFLHEFDGIGRATRGHCRIEHWLILYVFVIEITREYNYCDR